MTVSWLSPGSVPRPYLLNVLPFPNGTELANQAFNVWTLVNTPDPHCHLKVNFLEVLVLPLLFDYNKAKIRLEMLSDQVVEYLISQSQH